jgi:hypothetical protein
MKTLIFAASIAFGVTAAQAQTSGSATPPEPYGQTTGDASASGTSGTGTASASKPAKASKGKHAGHMASGEQRSTNAAAREAINTPGVTPNTNGSLPETNGGTPGAGGTGSATADDASSESTQGAPAAQ